MSAHSPLSAFAGDRFLRVSAQRADGRRVVGYVGADVPRELIEAAGFLPVRLAPVEVGSSADADAILGPGVDEPVRLVLAGLLEGRYPIDFLVLCHDSEHTVRLYTSLRALGASVLPPMRFLDLLHLPTLTTAAYNVARLHELGDALAGWAERPLVEADVAAAIAAGNENRRLLRRIDARRRDGRLTGTELLAVVAAGSAMLSDDHERLLTTLLAESHEPARPRRRIFVLGSSHDTPEVYEAIEADGATIVGEDHSWGVQATAKLVDEHTEPFQALAERHRFAGAGDAAAAAAAAGADVALVWLREGDEALAWSLPAERSAFAERGIPLLVFRRQSSHPADETRRQLAEAAGET